MACRQKQPRREGSKPQRLPARPQQACEPCAGVRKAVHGWTSGLDGDPRVPKDTSASDAFDGAEAWMPCLHSRVRPVRGNCGSSADLDCYPRTPPGVSAVDHFLVPTCAIVGRQCHVSSCGAGRRGHCCLWVVLPPNVELTGAQRRGALAVRPMMNQGGCTARVPCRCVSG